MEATQGATTKLLDQWKRLNRSLKWSLIAIAALVVALIAVIIIGNTGTEYEILYAALEPDAAAEVYTLLQDVNVPFKIEGTSRVTILIPKGQRDELLIRLNNEGYPGTDADLYSYYNNIGIGSTDFDRRISLQFQLEQRIAYSLKRMDKIKNAIVMVTLGEQSRYSLGNQGNVPAQASVTLELRDGATLTEQEADTIRELVVKSVGQLAPENITIADSGMRQYRMSSAEETDDFSNEQIDLRNQAQQLIQDQVYNMLTPVFGPGYVTTSAAVELDFDRRSTQSVTYEPPGSEENMGIIVSLRQTASQMMGEGTTGGVVGFDPNGAAPFYPENWSTDPDSGYFQYTQELNAEVNEVREQVESQRGKFKSIQVAVTIDAGEEWDEQIDTLRDHVAKAVGVDAANVSVMRTPFKVNQDLEELLNNIPDPGDETEGVVPLWLYVAIGGAVLAMAFVVFMILRANKKRRKQFEDELARIQEETRQLEARHVAELQQQQLELQQDELQAALMEDDPAKVRLNEIQNLADEKPEVVAQLLRNWLTDEFGR